MTGVLSLIWFRSKESWKEWLTQRAEEKFTRGSGGFGHINVARKVSSSVFSSKSAYSAMISWQKKERIVSCISLGKVFQVAIWPSD